MNLKTAIDKRTSRRTFKNEQIDKKDMDLLQAEVRRGNEEYGLNCQLVEDGGEAFQSLRKSYGFFKGVRTVLAMKGLENTSDLKEKNGYFGEELVLLATQLGLGSCWVAGTFDKDNKIFNLQNGEQLVCVILVGKVDSEKTMKEKMIKKVTGRKSKTIEEMSITDVPLPRWFLESMEAVRKAPSSLNSQKVMFEYKDGDVIASVPDTFRSDLIDLGIAKLHFEIVSGKKFAWGNHAKLD